MWQWYEYCYWYYYYYSYITITIIIIIIIINRLSRGPLVGLLIAATRDPPVTWYGDVDRLAAAACPAQSIFLHPAKVTDRNVFSQVTIVAD